jgi:hypothetical protein
MKRVSQKKDDEYVDLKGRSHSLADLDSRERSLIGELKLNAARQDWNEFSNFWMARVHEFYSARGLSRREILESVAFRIGQDLASRIAVAAGLARAPDYRDELEEIIRRSFRTRRDFCKATGLSEDMLSHVLSRRKHLAVDTLATALDRIGYALRVVPIQRSKRRVK